MGGDVDNDQGGRTSLVREVDEATPELAERDAPAEPKDATSDGHTAMELALARLQKAVQQESRRFQTLSNTMKARHDTAMNTIRSMKG